jgi:hypothetical protein
MIKNFFFKLELDDVLSFFEAVFITNFKLFEKFEKFVNKKIHLLLDLSFWIVQ